MTRLRYVPETGKYVPAKGGELLHFKEFESAQFTKEQADAMGAHFDPRDGVTTVRYEKSLREHMARERARGRDVRWREH